MPACLRCCVCGAFSNSVVGSVAGVSITGDMNGLAAVGGCSAGVPIGGRGAVVPVSLSSVAGRGTSLITGVVVVVPVAGFDLK